MKVDSAIYEMMVVRGQFVEPSGHSGEWDLWKRLAGLQNSGEWFVVSYICDMRTGNILIKILDAVYDEQALVI